MIPRAPCVDHLVVLATDLASGAAWCEHTLGVAPAATLMVGDSAHDMQMALNAQVAAIAVTCGAHSAQVLQQYQPLCCLQQPTELADII